MAEQKIELRKVRDFSDNLNDTFQFIRQNLKPLMLSFLCISGVFMLLAAIFSGLQQKDTGNLLEQIMGTGRRAGQLPSEIFTVNFFLVLLFAWINIVAMQGVIIAYMKYYEQHDGAKPTIDEVFKIFRSYFPALLIYSVIIAIVMTLGFVLCIFPGIFLVVALMPFSCIVMLEDQSFGAAFSRCFALIKDNFWISFGIYILVYIIYTFSAGIITAIVGAVTGVLYYFTTKDLNTTVDIISSILNIFSFLFYIIFYVSVVLHYYNLAERKDGVGMMRKLDSIGDGTTNFDNIQEQY
ncbi:MAG: hypothetical protein LH478_11390 [Chitinophagaceae bacterium]|nr:hypothetical protein [Chitinophagaceae bacterium]